MRRDGSIAIIDVHDNTADWPIEDTKGELYSKDGKYTTSGNDHPLDIVAEAVPRSMDVKPLTEGVFHAPYVEQNTTPNDPKGEVGATKPPLGLIPSIAMEAAAWAHKLGSEKYGTFNWRVTGVCASTYVSAIMRHLNAWRDGEDLDPESGVSHLGHVIASANILLDSAHCGTLQDDRSKLPQINP